MQLELSTQHDEQDGARNDPVEPLTGAEDVGRAGEHDGKAVGGEEGLQAVSEWYSIRSRYRAREMDEEQFKQLRSDFVERYDEVTKNGIVNVAIKFITQKTEVTGLIRTTLRD